MNYVRVVSRCCFYYHRPHVNLNRSRIEILFCSRLMALAVKFHQRVERFVANTNSWRRDCDSDERYPTESSSSIDTISVLEQSLKKHKVLHDRINEAYKDVGFAPLV